MTPKEEARALCKFWAESMGVKLWIGYPAPQDTIWVGLRSRKHYNSFRPTSLRRHIVHHMCSGN